MIEYLISKDRVGIITQVFAVYVKDKEITGFKGSVLLQPETASLAKLRDDYHRKIFDLMMQGKKQPALGQTAVIESWDEFDYLPEPDNWNWKL